MEEVVFLPLPFPVYQGCLVNFFPVTTRGGRTHLNEPIVVQNDLSFIFLYLLHVTCLMQPASHR